MRQNLEARRVIGLSLGIWIIATAGMLLEIPFFLLNYFILMWWPWIAILWAWHPLRGLPHPWRSPREFLHICLASVAVWVFFEAYNLRIQNWAYENIYVYGVERWICYTISFATVLPGVFLAANLVYHGLYRKCEGVRNGILDRGVGATLGSPTVLSRAGQAPPLPRTVWVVSLSVGLSCALAPLLWPTHCFALTWVAYIFLTDPLNDAMGEPSLWRDHLEGHHERITAALAGGSLSGFVWEGWNWHAGSKWVYTLPFFDEKVFEMPWIGFLGFPPFAVECLVMFCTLRGVFRRLTRAQGMLAFMALATLVCCVYARMDILTVRN
ncbi:MAG: hypothetical protein AB7F75_11445 [Planctomycetota bacterium]